jgi:RNA polymerase sigma factor (sigma-70 family)
MADYTDEEFFDLCYNIFSKLVINVAQNKLASYELAQEICQEVFFALSKEIWRFKELEEVKAWLFVTTRNKIIDYWRTEKSYFAEVPLLQEELDELTGSGAKYYDSSDLSYEMEKKEFIKELCQEIYRM